MLLNANQISNFIKESATSKRAQVGIDLSVKSIQRVNCAFNPNIPVIYKGKTDIPSNLYKDVLATDGFYDLYPSVYSVTFNEGISIPANHTAFVIHRSSLYRIGNIIMSPVWDPGFACDNMNTTLIVNTPMRVEEGARLAQVIFHENYDAEKYDGQWQGLSGATHKEESK